MSAKVEKWPGTALTERDIKDGKVLAVHYKLKAQYRWDCGVAIGRYLAELKEGRIIARRCDRCRRVLVPPRMFCEECFRSTDAWVYTEDTGVVNTFCISHISWDTTRLETPQIAAVVDLDGASKGIGILHLLSEVDPQDVKVGMRVQAVWKKPEEREGAITDIRYFKPLL